MTTPDITLHGPGSSPAYFSQHNELMQAVFGFSFAPWRAAGHWTGDYTCCSVIQDGRMLANVGIYRMDLRVGGRPLQAWQIGAVATHPDCRGQGLSRRLLQYALALHPHEPYFLNANDSVLDFYPRFGFTLLPDRRPTVPLCLTARPGALRRLAPDDPVVGQSLAGRACLSGLLDCANTAPIHWFHLLMGLSGHLYEIPALGMMLAAEQDGAVLHLSEIWAAQPVPLEQLAAHLDFPGVEKVIFGFNPDRLVREYSLEAYTGEGAIFVRDLDFPPNAIVPELIRT